MLFIHFTRKKTEIAALVSVLIVPLLNLNPALALQNGTLLYKFQLDVFKEHLHNVFFTTGISSIPERWAGRTYPSCISSEISLLCMSQHHWKMYLKKTTILQHTYKGFFFLQDGFCGLDTEDIQETGSWHIHAHKWNWNSARFALSVF